MLSREQILAAPAALVPLEIPEWGGMAYLRPLDVAGIMAWSDAAGDEARRAAGEPQALVAQRALVDDAGQPLFTAEDVPALMAMPGGLMLRIANAALAASGIQRQDTPAGN
jgi:hypothetical protein